MTIYAIEFAVWSQEHPGDPGFLYTSLEKDLGYFADLAAAEAMLASLNGSYRLVTLLPGVNPSSRPCKCGSGQAVVTCPRGELSCG